MAQFDRGHVACYPGGVVLLGRGWLWEEVNGDEGG